MGTGVDHLSNKYILNAYSFGVALSIKQLKKISFTIINKGINKKDFVTCTDLLFNKGDLGNQLFKYAVIRKYSRKYGVPVLLPEPNAHRLSELNIQCEYYDKHILLIKNYLIPQSLRKETKLLQINVDHLFKVL